jgi:DNA polymerase-3 subunit epsilon
MREIVLDTETTGMDPAKGDKLVEIGCVELENHVPTGRVYHQYINPERDVPAEAVAVHGLSYDKLKDKPVFAQVYTEMMDFIGDGRLVIHNAEFDMKFINWELKQVGHAPIPMNRVTDTLAIARKKYPGSPASLDALCRRFGIDNSERTYHGALLDSELLAEVYLELMGGRQHGLSLAPEKSGGTDASGAVSSMAQRTRAYREPRPHAPSAEEMAAHEALLDKMKEPVWRLAAKK